MKVFLKIKMVYEVAKLIYHWTIYLGLSPIGSSERESTELESNLREIDS